MSIYSALAISAPTVAYTSLHQVKKGVATKGYVKTMQEMHQMIRAESEKVEQIWKNHVQELSASSVQTTRGNLSQFLTLPLDTDVKEIHRILGDQVAQLSRQLAPVKRFGVISSTEGRIVWEREQNAVIRQIIDRGRDHLMQLGFQVGKTGTDIFESQFIVEGGLNLDIIEHIVRDRIGTYAHPHGKHIEEFGSMAFAAHNLVLLHGAMDGSPFKYEAAIHFSKEGQQYVPFLKKLAEVFEHLQQEYRFDHMSLWQRKLGLGGGTEFNVRVRCHDKKAIKDFVLGIAKIEDKEGICNLLVKSGYLIIKEQVH